MLIRYCSFLGGKVRCCSTCLWGILVTSKALSLSLWSASRQRTRFWKHFWSWKFLKSFNVNQRLRNSGQQHCLPCSHSLISSLFFLFAGHTVENCLKSIRKRFQGQRYKWRVSKIVSNYKSLSAWASKMCKWFCVFSKTKARKIECHRIQVMT